MNDDPLLAFFKLLVDFRRLQIAGLLATEPMSIEALAARLGAPPGEIAKALAPLREAGLVAAEEAAAAPRFHLDRRALEALARETLKNHRARPDTSDPTAPFFGADGRLRSLPASAERLRLVLARVAARLEPERRYSERELSDLLATLHDDPAFLRRALVDEGFLAREVAVGRMSEYHRTDRTA